MRGAGYTLLTQLLVAAGHSPGAAAAAIARAEFDVLDWAESNVTSTGWRCPDGRTPSPPRLPMPVPADVRYPPPRHPIPAAYERDACTRARQRNESVRIWKRSRSDDCWPGESVEPAPRGCG